MFLVFPVRRTFDGRGVYDVSVPISLAGFPSGLYSIPLRLCLSTAGYMDLIISLSLFTIFLINKPCAVLRSPTCAGLRGSGPSDTVGRHCHKG